MQSRKAGLGWFMVGAVALALAAGPARTADHRDGPIFGPSVDIADLFAFRNPNNGQIGLAMTVNPYTIAGVATFFSSEVLHQIKIDNTGDLKEDLVFQFTFSAPGRDQQFRMVGPVRPRKVGTVNFLITRGPTLTGSANPGKCFVEPSPAGDEKMRAFAGPRDDPFFSDVIFVRGILAIGPAIGRPPGRDFAGGLNVSLMLVEVPPAALRGGKSNIIRVWGTTSQAQKTLRSPTRDNRSVGAFVQVDRMGKPLTANALILPAAKNTFNRLGPDGDAAFLGDAINRILQINGGNHDHAHATANTFLPDVLTLDMTRDAGFASFNGRRWDDDVTDVALARLTNGRFGTDAVSFNDAGFFGDFPFFPPAHEPE